LTTAKARNKSSTATVILAFGGGALALGALAYVILAGIPDGKAFSLVDHTGRAVTDKDYRGRYILAFFGYTSCPDICPTELTAIAEALNILGEAGAEVVPIFITVDPERDTPEHLKGYVENFHPRMVGLTGTQGQIAAAAKAYRAQYVKLGDEDNDPDTYYMGHTSTIYLSGPDGKALFSFERGSGPEKIAAEIQKFIGHS